MGLEFEQCGEIPELPNVLASNHLVIPPRPDPPSGLKAYVRPGPIPFFVPSPTPSARASRRGSEVCQSGSPPSTPSCRSRHYANWVLGRMDEMQFDGYGFTTPSFRARATMHSSIALSRRSWNKRSQISGYFFVNSSSRACLAFTEAL